MSDTPEYLDEVQLWRAALLQALQDATLPEDIKGSVSIERARALAFICTSIGVTAEDFDAVCDMAGVDPQVFREEAQNFIKSGNRFLLRNEWKNLRGKEPR